MKTIIKHSGRVRTSRGRYERILSDNVKYRTKTIAVGLYARNILAAEALHNQVSVKTVVTKAFNHYLSDPDGFKSWCRELTSDELYRDCQYNVPVTQKAVLEQLIRCFGRQLDEVEIILSLIIEYYGQART